MFVFTFCVGKYSQTKSWFRTRIRRWTGTGRIRRGRRWRNRKEAKQRGGTRSFCTQLLRFTPKLLMFVVMFVFTWRRTSPVRRAGSAKRDLKEQWIRLFVNLVYTWTITQPDEVGSVAEGCRSQLTETRENKGIFCLFTLRLYWDWASPGRWGKLLTGKNATVSISKASSANWAGKFIYVNALKRILPTRPNPANRADPPPCKQTPWCLMF